MLYYDVNDNVTSVVIPVNEETNHSATRAISMTEYQAHTSHKQERKIYMFCIDSTFCYLQNCNTKNIR